MPKTILLLGATGPSGIAILRASIASSINVLILCRNPSKLPLDLVDHPLVTVLPAAPLTDIAALNAAVALRPDAIVSMLGPPSTELTKWGWLGSEGKTPVFVNFYRALVEAMREFEVRRVLLMGTPSLYEARDKRSFARAAMVWGIWAVAARAWRNVVDVGALFDEVGEGVDWTVFRIGLVKDGRFCSGRGEGMSWG